MIDWLDANARQHLLSARKDGYVEGRTRIDTGALQISYELVLRRGARVEGIVLASNGEPAAGARLHIGNDASAYDRLDAVARDDGRFVFPNVRAGEHDLVTECSGAAIDQRRLAVPPGEHTISVRIQLTAGHFVAGRVTDTQGAPLADIGAHARTVSEHDERYVGTPATSDAEGRFRLDSLPADVTVEFYSREVLRKVVPLAVDRADHVVVLERAGGLAGRVVDARDGRPLPRFRIRFAHSNIGDYSAVWMREGTQFTDTDGYWATQDEQLQPGGTVVVEAKAESYAPARATATVSLSPDKDALVLALAPGATVEGRVLTAGGLPLAGATVKFFAEEFPLNERDSHDFHGRIQARTDAQGRFWLTDVPAGEVSLLVTSPEASAVRHGPFPVVAGGTSERTIVLPPLVHVSGTLVDASGAPGGQTTVWLRGGEPGQQVNEQTTSDVTGRFRFARAVSAGSYELSAVPIGNVPPFTVVGATIAVADQDVDVRIGPPGACALEATVRSDEPLPAELSAQLVDFTSKPMRRVLGKVADGRMSLTGVPAGTWTVSVHGFQNDALWVGTATGIVLAPGQPARATITVKRMQRR